MAENIEKYKSLSKDIVTLSRNTILVNLRFMDMALAELVTVPSFEENGIATDGVHFIYNPMYILKSYAKDKYLINRNYLHILLHCLYRHNFISSIRNQKVWDLACDIAVENNINELRMISFESPCESNQNKVINELKRNIKILTAEKIYKYYLGKGFSDEKYEKIRENFYADSHDIWYSAGKNAEEEDGEPKDNYNLGDNSNSNSQNTLGTGEKQLQAERWKEISERVEKDLETFSKQKSDTAGSLIQNLGEVNRERYDYKSFLKKFAIMGEAMKINDDEFDYVFYTYGLKLFKNTPLIEPLEYKDIKMIRDFAIIIDTSGSVKGELVQAFVNKTYNILKETESFFSKINLYIIQCDAEVQEAVKITSQEEFENYIKNMKLCGFGGTDFRPAFDFVNNLVEKGELPKLKGVIYFTDGFGYFPSKKPSYDAAFVFIRGEAHEPNVPPWAIKLILDKEEI